MDTTIRIDGERLRRDFEALAAIGATGDGGVHRPALGPEHLAARRWFRERIAADGLEFSSDSAGNHSARLAASDSGARTLLLGSHLDSVPRGGRFDGALGVLAAYEVLRAVRDTGERLPVHLEAIDFTDEEGTLVGLLGSRALAGSLTVEELERPRGGSEALEAGLARAGLDRRTLLAARRDPRSLAGFLELHIEQGPRLAAAGIPVGIVRSIVGIGSARLTFAGRADHAGTTPLDAREDAGLGAAACIVEANDLVGKRFTDCVVNFGRIAFEPGADNVVPERATLAMEYRGPDREAMAALEAALLETAHAAAGRHRLRLEVERQAAIAPSPCADTVRRAFARAAERQGLRHIELASGAGHDTMALAAICPAGMIFVPSTGGSHSPREFAEWDDCLRGAQTLLLATLELATAGR